MLVLFHVLKNYLHCIVHVWCMYIINYEVLRTINKIICSEGLLKPSNIHGLTCGKMYKVGENLIPILVSSRMCRHWHLNVLLFTLLIASPVIHVVEAGLFSYGRQQLPSWMNVMTIFCLM